MGVDNIFQDNPSIDDSTVSTDGGENSSSGGEDGFSEITEPTSTPQAQPEAQATPEAIPEPTNGEIQITPEPLPDAVPVLSPTPAPEEPPEEMTVHDMDDLYQLLSDWMDKQEEYRKTDTEAVTKAVTTYTEEQTQYQAFLQEQSRNIFSVDVLILLTLAFASGILLARVVWRKL